MKLALTFTDYTNNDVGALREFPDVWRITRTKRGTTLIVQTPDSTANYAFELRHVADLRLAVLDDAGVQS